MKHISVIIIYIIAKNYIKTQKHNANLHGIQDNKITYLAQLNIEIYTKHNLLCMY